MSKKTYRIITIVATVVAVIGAAAYYGGIKEVNIGVVLCPAIIALCSLYKYRKTIE